MHLNVPEVDPITAVYHHGFNDYYHIMKCILNHTREKGPEDSNLKRFAKVCMTPRLGQQFQTTPGGRKQSFPDAVHMLSFLVAKLRRDSGYERDGCPGKLKCTTSLQWTNGCLQLETSTGIESITVGGEIAPLQISMQFSPLVIFVTCYKRRINKFLKSTMKFLL